MATKQPSTLIEALNAFQQKYHAAGLDGKNPFFKSKYTTLSQALLAVQQATEFGLCLTQLNDFVMTPDGEIITIVITKLMHVSGDEPLISKFPVPKIPTNVKNVHQEAGSAQTYARRYGLLSVYGLANDDDDGNSLMKTPPPKTNNQVAASGEVGVYPSYQNMYANGAGAGVVATGGLQEPMAANEAMGGGFGSAW